VQYQLPDQAPPIRLITPDDHHAWNAVGLADDGRYALLIGDRTHPTAVIVIAGSREELAHYLAAGGALAITLGPIRATLTAAASDDERDAVQAPCRPLPSSHGIELSALPHAGLRVPHSRLSITGHRGWVSFDGIAFTATLRIDNMPAGTVFNEGLGGPTGYHPNDLGLFHAQQLRDFAASCRTAGGDQPHPDAVLDDLVTEMVTTRRITAATRRGQTPLRLLTTLADSTADYLTVGHATARPPRSDTERQLLAAELVESDPPEPGEWWQAWTGTSWVDLTTRPTPQPQGRRRSSRWEVAVSSRMASRPLHCAGVPLLVHIAPDTDTVEPTPGGYQRIADRFRHAADHHAALATILRTATSPT